MKITPSPGYNAAMDLVSLLFGPSVPQIDPQEARDKLTNPKPPFLLDVRETSEYRQAHLSGSLLIPLGELESQLDKLPREREIIVCCASGSRSARAVRLLNRLGYQSVNLRGGLNLWQRLKLPLISGGTPSTKKGG